MTFEQDFDDLRLRADTLKRWAVIVALGSVALFLGALVLHPGPTGAPFKFEGVQMTFHLDHYFDAMGVTGSLSDDKMILGVRLAMVRGALSLVVWLICLFGLGCLVRLRWRPTLACFLGAALVAALSATLSLKDGYRSASEDQFGVHLLRPETLQARGIAVPQRVIEDYQRMRERADTFRAQAEAAKVEPFADYLRYTRAQVAYLETDPAMVARMLSAISEQDYLRRRFEPTTDIDYRIRVMREYAEAKGFPLPPEAYRPKTGLSFTALRIAAMLLTATGVAGLGCSLFLFEIVRSIRRRLSRLQDLVKAFRETTQRASEGFGRRLQEAEQSPA